MTALKRAEEAILRVAKERGVVMGIVAANHMAIEALTAIREPSEEMVKAGEAWRDHCSDVDSLFSEMMKVAIYGSA